MKKIVIVGAGNVGVYAAKALRNCEDMQLCAFVRRKIFPVTDFPDVPVYKTVTQMPLKPDGALICLPSEIALPMEKSLLEAGIASVDAFDIHGEIESVRRNIDESAKLGGVAAITGAGWDPGLDSVIRTLLQATFPKGETYTSFGPGMSMGHSAALRQIPGVEHGISVTLPLGRGKHKRKIYAVLKENALEHEVRAAILQNKYFEHDLCSVEFVKDISPYLDNAHGVKIERETASFEMRINNPEITANLMVAAMRAAFLQKPGAYFMTEIPPANFCFGDVTNLV